MSGSILVYEVRGSRDRLLRLLINCDARAKWWYGIILSENKNDN